MSRTQQSAVINTAAADSAADQSNAEKATAAESADIGNYSAQLAKFASSNPYTQGGEFDTATNQKLSGVADAGSAALTNQLQTQAQRTGENAGSAVATAAEAARANQRQLSGGEASATQERIENEAGYNDKVLAASEVPAQLEAGEAATNLSAAGGTLNTDASASATPGFWDTLGDSFASQLGKTAAGGNVQSTK